MSYLSTEHRGLSLRVVVDIVEVDLKQPSNRPVLPVAFPFHDCK